MLVGSSNDLTDIRPPFVGLHEIVKLKVFERIALCDTTFGPSIHIDKGWVGIKPGAPFLHEPLHIEASSPISEFPGTISDRLEGDGIGVHDSRHVDWRRGRKMIGREEWVLVRD